MLISLDAIQKNDCFDVVVIGAGGAGLHAALFAALEGAKVLVVEHTGLVGGTTALSAGTTWVPGTHHSATVNPTDTVQETARYLDNAIGQHSPSSLRQAFLQSGAVAVKQLEQHTGVHFRPYPKHPDYLSELPGSSMNGRALEPLPFDARQLGPLFPIVRPPIPEFTVLGGMMVDRTDISHLLGLTKSFASFSYATRILLRHGLDRLRWSRGTRWVMGNALIGRLLLSLSRQKNVSLLLDTEVAAMARTADGPSSASGLEGLNGNVGLTLRQNGQLKTIRVTGGIILASGGFNRHAQKRGQMLPGVPPAWSPGAPGATGVAQDMALALGARFGTSGASHAFWAPVSLRQRPDGSQAVFPHFVMDRAKPGMITVNQTGQRFLNESTSYHRFALAMQEAHKTSASVPAYLVCDATALRNYGLGMVRPGGAGLAPFLADGYLTQAASLAELAQKLNINPEALQATITQFNQYAAEGKDPDFHRGETAYQHNIGDAIAGGKNPNLGPLATAPFYAIRLYPGDIGASTGLVTDNNACVLDAADQPIGGLYAVGNDMQSVMGGIYTAPGITIGPGLVFASLAAKHAARRAKAKH